MGTALRLSILACGTTLVVGALASPSGASPSAGVRLAASTLHTTSIRTAAHHVVKPGEWLWSIARTQLGVEGAPASAHDVAVRVWTIEAWNAPLLGGHPNLIRPGMNLIVGYGTGIGGCRVVNGHRLCI